VAQTVIMPALGMAQETGRLVRWLKSEGDDVQRGEPLMEVETDKAVVEVESPGEGVLGGIRAREGDEVPVGETIAYLLSPGEAPPAGQQGGGGGAAAAAAAPDAAPPAPGRQPAAAAPPGEAFAGPPPRVAASPKARRLAMERGQDLASLSGSGPGGAVLEADLAGIAGMADVAAGGPVRMQDSRIWRAMAENTTHSWQQTPHFFLFRDVDATQLLEARGRLGAGVTVTDLLGVLVARCLAEHPLMNLDTPEVNLGLAVATEAGLVVPVIHGADGLGFAEFAERRAAVAERARGGRLHSGDLGGGTFTLSNLGMYGVDAFTAIVTEGQAGILAVGRITDRVVAVGGQPAVRPMVALALSCNHRLVDGARGAEFLSDLAERLEQAAATA
jgi:pyruvate dehydrogenase E2 component (dihydrolipoamide acetyltransferase)